MTSEAHLSPPDPYVPRYPEESALCVECDSWERDGDTPYHTCPGFAGNGCESKLCENCGDDHGRCEKCWAAYRAALRAHWTDEAPLPWNDPDACCDDCDYTYSDGPGWWCDGCAAGCCPEHGFIGSDNKARCESCAKELSGLK